MPPETCPICENESCTCDQNYEYYEPTTGDLDDE